MHYTKHNALSQCKTSVKTSTMHATSSTSKQHLAYESGEENLDRLSLKSFAGERSRLEAREDAAEGKNPL